MQQTRTSEPAETAGRSRRGLLRRIPIGPMIVIAGFLLPTVMLTSCEGSGRTIDSSASGIQLVTSPVADAFPEVRASLDGVQSVSQLVAGLIMIDAVIVAAVQALMRRAVRVAFVVMFLSALGIGGLPVLLESVALASTEYTASLGGWFLWWYEGNLVEPAIGMGVILVGFGTSLVSFWYWFLADRNRPHPAGHIIAVTIALIAVVWDIADSGWSLDAEDVPGAVVSTAVIALVVEVAWLLIWTLLHFARRLRAKASPLPIGRGE